MAPVLPSPTPIITAKTFFVSVSICLATALLIAVLSSFAMYIKHRIEDPERQFCRKLGLLMLDIKRVVELGEKNAGLYPGMYSSNFGVRDHILYMFRHIDKIPYKGTWPDLGEAGIHAQALVDVTWGQEVEGIRQLDPVASSPAGMS